jgi:pimeloyl-ACP methyl ester carboxylesterase
MKRLICFLFLIAALISTAAVAVATAAYILNAKASRAWIGSHPSASTIIKAGNVRLSAEIKGTGAPSFVILTGEGSLAAEWAALSNELAKTSTVLRYDRAGYGRSGAPADDRSSAAICIELQKLLAASNLPAPYILIGHSFGGLCAVHFAELNPYITAGVVLVDPLPSDGISGETVPSLADRVSSIEAASRLGRSGWFRYLKKTPYTVSAGIRPEVIEFLSRSDLRETLLSELYTLPQDTEAIKNKVFPAVPLAVISRGGNQKTLLISHGMSKEKAEKTEKIWKEKQKAYLLLSHKSFWVEADNSGHSIHIDRADLIIQTANLVYWQAKR